MDEGTRATVLAALEQAMLEINSIEDAMEVPKGTEADARMALRRMIIEKLSNGG